MSALALTPLVTAALALPSPVLAGDWPDPSAMRLSDGSYAAVTTSEGWAPAIRVLQTNDLKRWRIVGSVFPKRPRWVKRNFWAPEITRMGKRYAVYYSALPRKKGRWYCIGMATASRLEGPWRDLGHPLRCGKQGSIDPSPVRDERGRRYLLFKNDGNAFKSPTRIFAQRLIGSGRAVRGRPHQLIRSDKRWEDRIVEAPTLIRRGGFNYLFYSGSTCCERRCAYAVGVARSKTLLGRWRKHPGNPILRGGHGWRCPGHTSVVQAPTGPIALFHAFRSGAGRLAGRQVLAATLSFRGGWPRIGAGRPAAASPGAGPTSFADSFASLAPDWEWPLERVPGISTGDGLLLRAPRGSSRPDGGLLSRRVERMAFTATTVIDRDRLAGKAAGGLAFYRPNFAGIGIAVDRSQAYVWRKQGASSRRLGRVAAPASSRIHLRLRARGARLSFAVSSDGVNWTPVASAASAPMVHSGRIALTSGGSGGAAVRFVSAALTDER